MRRFVLELVRRLVLQLNVDRYVEGLADAEIIIPPSEDDIWVPAELQVNGDLRICPGLLRPNASIEQPAAVETAKGGKVARIVVRLPPWLRNTLQQGLRLGSGPSQERPQGCPAGGSEAQSEAKARRTDSRRSPSEDLPRPPSAHAAARGAQSLRPVVPPPLLHLTVGAQAAAAAAPPPRAARSPSPARAAPSSPAEGVAERQPVVVELHGLEVCLRTFTEAELEQLRQATADEALAALLGLVKRRDVPGGTLDAVAEAALTGLASWAPKFAGKLANLVSNVAERLRIHCPDARISLTTEAGQTAHLAAERMDFVAVCRAWQEKRDEERWFGWQRPSPQASRVTFEMNCSNVTGSCWSSADAPADSCSASWASAASAFSASKGAAPREDLDLAVPAIRIVAVMPAALSPLTLVVAALCGGDGAPAPAPPDWSRSEAGSSLPQQGDAAEDPWGVDVEDLKVAVRFAAPLGGRIGLSGGIRGLRPLIGIIDAVVAAPCACDPITLVSRSSRMGEEQLGRPASAAHNFWAEREEYRRLWVREWRRSNGVDGAGSSASDQRQQRFAAGVAGCGLGAGNTAGCPGRCGGDQPSSWGCGIRASDKLPSAEDHVRLSALTKAASFTLRAAALLCSDDEVGVRMPDETSKRLQQILCLALSEVIPLYFPVETAVELGNEVTIDLAIPPSCTSRGASTVSYGDGAAPSWPSSAVGAGSATPWPWLRVRSRAIGIFISQWVRPSDCRKTVRVLLEGLSATASSGRCATSLGGSDEVHLLSLMPKSTVTNDTTAVAEATDISDRPPTPAASAASKHQREYKTRRDGEGRPASWTAAFFALSASPAAKVEFETGCYSQEGGLAGPAPWGSDGERDVGSTEARSSGIVAGVAARVGLLKPGDEFLLRLGALRRFVFAPEPPARSIYVTVNLGVPLHVSLRSHTIAPLLDLQSQASDPPLAIAELWADANLPDASSVAVRASVASVEVRALDAGGGLAALIVELPLGFSLDVRPDIRGNRRTGLSAELALNARSGVSCVSDKGEVRPVLRAPSGYVLKVHASPITGGDARVSWDISVALRRPGRTRAIISPQLVVVAKRLAEQFVASIAQLQAQDLDLPGECGSPLSAGVGRPIDLNAGPLDAMLPGVLGGRHRCTLTVNPIPIVVELCDAVSALLQVKLSLVSHASAVLCLDSALAACDPTTSGSVHGAGHRDRAAEALLKELRGSLCLCEVQGDFASRRAGSWEPFLEPWGLRLDAVFREDTGFDISVYDALHLGFATGTLVDELVACCRSVGGRANGNNENNEPTRLLLNFTPQLVRVACSVANQLQEHLAPPRQSVTPTSAHCDSVQPSIIMEDSRDSERALVAACEASPKRNPRIAVLNLSGRPVAVWLHHGGSLSRARRLAVAAHWPSNCADDASSGVASGGLASDPTPAGAPKRADLSVSGAPSVVVLDHLVAVPSTTAVALRMGSIGMDSATVNGQLPHDPFDDSDWSPTKAAPVCADSSDIEDFMEQHRPQSMVASRATDGDPALDEDRAGRMSSGDFVATSSSALATSLPSAGPTPSHLRSIAEAKSCLVGVGAMSTKKDRRVVFAASSDKSKMPKSEMSRATVYSEDRSTKSEDNGEHSHVFGARTTHTWPRQDALPIFPLSAGWCTEVEDPVTFDGPCERVVSDQVCVQTSNPNLSQFNYVVQVLVPQPATRLLVVASPLRVFNYTDRDIRLSFQAHDLFPMSFRGEDLTACTAPAALLGADQPVNVEPLRLPPSPIGSVDGGCFGVGSGDATPRPRASYWPLPRNSVCCVPIKLVASRVSGGRSFHSRGRSSAGPAGEVNGSPSAAGFATARLASVASGGSMMAAGSSRMSDESEHHCRLRLSPETSCAIDEAEDDTWGRWLDFEGMAESDVLYACQTADGQLVYFRVRKLRQEFKEPYSTEVLNIVILPAFSIVNATPARISVEVSVESGVRSAWRRATRPVRRGGLARCCLRRRIHFHRHPGEPGGPRTPVIEPGGAVHLYSIDSEDPVSLRARFLADDSGASAGDSSSWSEPVRDVCVTCSHKAARVEIPFGLSMQSPTADVMCVDCVAAVSCPFWLLNDSCMGMFAGRRRLRFPEFRGIVLLDGRFCDIRLYYEDVSPPKRATAKGKLSVELQDEIAEEDFSDDEPSCVHAMSRLCRQRQRWPPAPEAASSAGLGLAASGEVVPGRQSKSSGTSTTSVAAEPPGATCLLPVPVASQVSQGHFRIGTCYHVFSVIRETLPSPFGELAAPTTCLRLLPSVMVANRTTEDIFVRSPGPECVDILLAPGQALPYVMAIGLRDQRRLQIQFRAEGVYEPIDEAWSGDIPCEASAANGRVSLALQRWEAVSKTKSCEEMWDADTMQVAPVALCVLSVEVSDDSAGVVSVAVSQACSLVVGNLASLVAWCAVETDAPSAVVPRADAKSAYALGQVAQTGAAAVMGAAVRVRKGMQTALGAASGPTGGGGPPCVGIPERSGSVVCALGAGSTPGSGGAALAAGVRGAGPVAGVSGGLRRKMEAVARMVKAVGRMGSVDATPDTEVSPHAFGGVELGNGWPFKVGWYDPFNSAGKLSTLKLCMQWAVDDELQTLLPPRVTVAVSLWRLTPQVVLRPVSLYRRGAATKATPAWRCRLAVMLRLRPRARRDLEAIAQDIRRRARGDRKQLEHQRADEWADLSGHSPEFLEVCDIHPEAVGDIEVEWVCGGCGRPSAAPSPLGVRCEVCCEKLWLEEGEDESDSVFGDGDVGAGAEAQVSAKISDVVVEVMDERAAIQQQLWSAAGDALMRTTSSVHPHTPMLRRTRSAANPRPKAHLAVHLSGVSVSVVSERLRQELFFASVDGIQLSVRRHRGRERATLSLHTCRADCQWRVAQRLRHVVAATAVTSGVARAGGCLRLLADRWRDSRLRRHFVQRSTRISKSLLRTPAVFAVCAPPGSTSTSATTRRHPAGTGVSGSGSGGMGVAGGGSDAISLRSSASLASPCAVLEWERPLLEGGENSAICMNSLNVSINQRWEVLLDSIAAAALVSLNAEVLDAVQSAASRREKLSEARRDFEALLSSAADRGAWLARFSPRGSPRIIQVQNTTIKGFEVAVWVSVQLTKLPTSLIPASFMFLLRVLSGVFAETLCIDGSTMCFSDWKQKEFRWSVGKVSSEVLTKYQSSVLFFLARALGGSNLLAIPRLLMPNLILQQVVNIFADLADIVDLSVFTMDPAYIQARREQNMDAQVESLQEGLEGAGEYLLAGILAVGDIVVKPVQACRTGGCAAVPRGLCVGLLSALFKPLDSFFQALRSLMQGVSASLVGRFRRRRQRRKRRRVRTQSSAFVNTGSLGVLGSFGPMASRKSSCANATASVGEMGASRTISRLGAITKAMENSGDIVSAGGDMRGPALQGQACLRLPRMLFGDVASVKHFETWHAQLQVHLASGCFQGVTICAAWRVAGGDEDVEHIVLCATRDDLILVDLKKQKDQWRAKWRHRPWLHDSVSRGGTPKRRTSNPGGATGADAQQPLRLSAVLRTGSRGARRTSLERGANGHRRTHESGASALRPSMNSVMKLSKVRRSRCRRCSFLIAPWRRWRPAASQIPNVVLRAWSWHELEDVALVQESIGDPEASAAPWLLRVVLRPPSTRFSVASPLAVSRITTGTLPSIALSVLPALGRARSAAEPGPEEWELIGKLVSPEERRALVRDIKQAIMERNHLLQA